MRYTTYSKYSGSILDALNIQDLLERLADFLLQSGFEGGPHYHPWWGWSGEDGEDKSLEALKEALLQALIESGQLTPEMLAELRGEGEGDEATRRAIAELLDELVRRLVEEGYLNTTQTPQMPAGHTEMTGSVDDARKAAQQVEFNLTQKGIDFLGYRTLKNLLGALGRSSLGSHD
ncbi:MAG: hypothetical protein GX539_08295, partial [Candidatus Cloacimonetes bacterium]|nr:hypothetical protein [Candidatus Cloacimonadota bacterium]